MSTEIERKPAQGPQQTPATLQLSVAAVGMGLRFVELEQTDLVSSCNQSRLEARFLWLHLACLPD